jgi:hypothetical protein
VPCAVIVAVPETAKFAKTQSSFTVEVNDTDGLTPPYDVLA